MSLMKKIVIIFVSVTVVSSIVFYSLAGTIVDETSSGELERGPGRLNAVIAKFKAEENKTLAKAREYSEYYQIKYKLDGTDYGINSKDIIDINKKAEKDPTSNMFLLDEKFKVLETLKSNDNIEVNEIENITAKSSKIISNEENIKKGFFTGVIRGEFYPYILSMKKIDNNKITNYILVAERMDEEFIDKIALETDRVINVVNSGEIDNNIKEMAVVNMKNRTYFCDRRDNSIDIYTEIDTIDSSNEKYYIKLSDERVVRNNAEEHVYFLVAIVIIITIIANFIIYILIRKNVINRILKINSTINSISKDSNLSIALKDDEKSDEIAELNNDLNSMLRKLKSYSGNLEFMSRQDTLTKLRNRYSINEHILCLTTHKREFSLFFIDLDNFKVINDTLGHNIGDELLMRVADVLSSVVEEEENLTVGRLGGDEFLIVREGKNDVEEVKRLAEKTLHRLNKCYEFNSYVYEIKASMGISFFSEHSSKGSEILQYSDIAMYCSKRDGGNKYSIFNEGMLEPLRLEKRLKKALEKEEFEMYLQPIYNMEKDIISGCEALIRWNDGDKVISPYKFISLAKRTGDIVAIDNFIFKEAVKNARSLIEAGKKDFYISINTSKLFLKQEKLIEFVLKELNDNKVNSKYIKMEVAEDEIIDDFEYTIGLLEKLRGCGIEIYLDDFGVGYSSFNHIKMLPIDAIKLDRSLLIDIDINIKSQEIVKTLINMAHNLNIDIICEGIEERAQVDILRMLNCDNIQGYYFGKPKPKESFINYI